MAAPLSNDVDTAEEDSHTGAAVAAGDGVDGGDAEKEYEQKGATRVGISRDIRDAPSLLWILS